MSLLQVYEEQRTTEIQDSSHKNMSTQCLKTVTNGHSAMVAASTASFRAEEINVTSSSLFPSVVFVDVVLTQWPWC